MTRPSARRPHRSPRRRVDARAPALRQARRRIPTRGGAGALALTAVFLTVGLPRWLVGSVDPGAGHTTPNFSKLCRDHGGTPRPAPAPAPGGAGQVCTVRYGGRVYLMDAVTPDGFDVDTARFQRQGCEEEARRDRRGSTAEGQQGPGFVYHPETGVCEHRP
jgi:hypothetical protein